MWAGGGEVDGDGRYLREGLHRRGGRRGARSGVEVAHHGKVVPGAKTAFRYHFAVEEKAIGLPGRVGEAIGGLDGEDVVTRGRNRELSAPTDRVVMRVYLGTGLRVLPVGLHCRLLRSEERRVGK